jgi:hypothetical protein
MCPSLRREPQEQCCGDWKGSVPLPPNVCNGWEADIPSSCGAALLQFIAAPTRASWRLRDVCAPARRSDL